MNSTPDLLYRRTLDGSQPPDQVGGRLYYWLDAETVDTNADSPALVKLGSTLALFYRKASGSYKQVHLRTSTDGGDNWSGPTVLTSEGVDVYQIQAVNDGGTVYVFWSLSNTSGLLQYRTSTDLANWSSPSSVGQAIGPLNFNTFPHFDIEKLSSGSWALTWLNVSHYNGPLISDRNAAYNTGYPVPWYACSTDLSSTSWSNIQELALPYSERWARGLSLAQDSSGTVYLSFSRYKVHWDYYAYYRTSGDDGASWAAATVYGYEPTRPPVGYTDVNALNSYLVVDSSGGVRSFWDQFAHSVGGSDAYNTQLFYRDLPSGAITAIPPVKEIQAVCDGCRPESFGCGDPVDVATGNFTLTETDFSIPGRGPGLVFARTYNAARLVDGPLGYGWRHSYQVQLSTYPNGEVLIVESSGQSDLYLPDGAGGYQPPPGRFAELVHNGDGTWTLTERNRVKRTFSADGKLTSIADRNGNAVSLSYSNGLLSTVTDPAGRSLSFGYDGSRITSVTDPLNRTVTFGYNGAGDLTSVTDKGGKAWTYSYDGSHRMLSKVDPNGHTVMTNTYGTLGRVKSQRDARNGETRFEYSGTEGASWVVDPRGNSTRYGFDTSYRVTEIRDPYNKSIFQYWDGRNNLTRIQDARRSPNENTYFTHDDWGNVLTRRNGLDKVWTYTYNSLNDPLTATDPLGHTTVYTYNVSGNLVEMSNPEGETTLFGRDGYGQMTSITDGRGKTTTFGYDSYGNQTTVTDPYSHTWTTAYDLAGRKESVTDPLNQVTSFDYDDGDNLLSITDGRGKVTSYGYDDVGNRTSVTDPNQKVTAYSYDEKNRLIRVTDAISGTTTYGYDGNDNMISLTDANGHSRSWTYDKNNLVLTETDAISKTTTYEYDGMGNRTKRIDANGATTNYTYDIINRLTTITYPQGSVTYGYDDANRRTSMTDGTGTTSYAYDRADRLTSVTFPGNRVVGYYYDDAGNRTRIVYPDGKTVDYSYDDANRMSTVTDWLTNTTTYGYDEAGRLTSTSLPNGVVETRSYNQANQLTSIVAASGGITLTSFVYTLDDAGIRTAVQALDGVESYAYDDLYRLTGVTYSDAITQTYTYDPVGNRLSKDEGGNLTDYSYDNGDRMLTAGGVSYTYDNNGNQTGRGADTFGWDYENRLTSATVNGTSVTYVYRGDGLRHSKTVGGNTTTYTWDVNSGLPVILQDRTYSYVYGLGLISQTDSSGNQSYFLGNGLGSTEALVDGSGNVIATYKYDVYGAVRASSGSGNTEYRFTGQQDDADLGYTYLRARYYDPATGRFLSKDPFPGFVEASETQNRYAYGGNNPCLFTDSSGLCGECSSCDTCGGVDETRDWLECLGECTAEQLGVRELLAASGIVAGSPLVATRGKFGGATPGTSVLSEPMARLLPQRGRFWAPTAASGLKGLRATTPVLGRAVARWIPVVGWAVLAYDAVSVGICTNDCLQPR